MMAGLINTYIPSFMVVCLSFVSFWIDVKAIPGRVTLGVTALLTLATQIVQARNSLPAVEYLTAMDVWLFGCLLMVFCSLIEFTMAHSWVETSSIVNLAPKRTVNQVCPKVLEGKPEAFAASKKMFKGSLANSGERMGTIMDGRRNKFDEVSRILFPIAVACFSIIYIVYYVCSLNRKIPISRFALNKYYYESK